MHRTEFLLELQRYHVADAGQRQLRDRMITFVESEPRCFERDNLSAHFTASAFITDADCTETVLVFHRKYNHWVQPGGHADGDADLQAVAMREAQEETGMTSLVFANRAIYDLEYFDNLIVPVEFRHTHYDVRYHFIAQRSEKPIANAESREAAWIRLQQLPELDTDESVRRLARKLLP